MYVHHLGRALTWADTARRLAEPANKPALDAGSAARFLSAPHKGCRFRQSNMRATVRGVDQPELTDAQRVRLTMMVELHERWIGWQRDRLHVLLWAAMLVDQGALTVGQVCQVLEISESTYHRHMRALRPVPGSALEHDAALEVEQALRGAGVVLEGKSLDEVKAQIAANPDAELALAGIGVWRARQQEDGTTRTEEG